MDVTLESYVFNAGFRPAASEAGLLELTDVVAGPRALIVREAFECAAELVSELLPLDAVAVVLEMRRAGAPERAIGGERIAQNTVHSFLRTGARTLDQLYFSGPPQRSPRREGIYGVEPARLLGRYPIDSLPRAPAADVGS